MKVDVSIKCDETGEIEFEDEYSITDRIEFKEMVWCLEDARDEIEFDNNICCTIYLSFDQDEAEELGIMEEDCELCVLQKMV